MAGPPRGSLDCPDRRRSGPPATAQGCLLFSGLYAGAAGMNAYQRRLDATASDLANLSTTGYKSQRVSFADLLYSEAGDHRAIRPDAGMGAGSLAGVIDRDRSQGSMQSTGKPLDVAISGGGYLQVRRSDGSMGLTRDGNLHLDNRRRLCTATGELVWPQVTLPDGVAPDTVSIDQNGALSTSGRQIGRLPIVNVAVPERLAPGENNLLVPTGASGQPARAAAGSFSVTQGMLEGSNVDMATAMTDMIEAQRGYELGSRVVRNMDELLSIANSIRR